MDLARLVPDRRLGAEVTVIEVLDAALEELPDGGTPRCVRSLCAGSRAAAGLRNRSGVNVAMSRPAAGTPHSPHAIRPL